MKILINETVDKKTRTIINLDKQELIDRLAEDLGYVEVIPMDDVNSYVRIYFDIDQPDVSDDPLEKVLGMISSKFACEKDSWSIASSHRSDKLSYHIVSNKFATQLKTLRRVTRQLKADYSVFDDKVLYFGLCDDLECGYFRLPNQTKRALNKNAPPLTIVRGTIEDFFITDVQSLVLSCYNGGAEYRTISVETRYD